MHRLVLVAIAALAAGSAAPARAQFQGRLEYELRHTAGGGREAGKGTAVVWISPAGARTELSLPPQQSGARGGRLVTLWRREAPARVYFVNDERKVFSSMDLSAEEDGERPAYEVTRLGPGEVAGRRCERARISRGSGAGEEVCVTSALGKLPMTLVADRGSLSLWSELRKAGLDGVPVSWKGGAEGEEGFAMTLTSVRKGPVPRSRLEVPAGYAETSMVGALAPPERAKELEEGASRLRDELEKLSPEQRKQLEKLLEQHGK